MKKGLVFSIVVGGVILVLVWVLVIKPAGAGGSATATPATATPATATPTPTSVPQVTSTNGSNKWGTVAWHSENQARYERYGCAPVGGDHEENQMTGQLWTNVRGFDERLYFALPAGVTVWFEGHLGGTAWFQDLGMDPMPDLVKQWGELLSRDGVLTSTVFILPDVVRADSLVRVVQNDSNGNMGKEFSVVLGDLRQYVPIVVKVRGQDGTVVDLTKSQQAPASATARRVASGKPDPNKPNSGEARFVQGDEVWGYEIFLDSGQKCSGGNCYLPSAPGSGVVKDGVVNPWPNEVPRGTSPWKPS